MIKLSLANKEVESFAGAINRAHGTCWARACALASDRARLTEIPALDSEVYNCIYNTV